MAVTSFIGRAHSFTVDTARNPLSMAQGSDRGPPATDPEALVCGHTFERVPPEPQHSGVAGVSPNEPPRMDSSLAIRPAGRESRHPARLHGRNSRGAGVGGSEEVPLHDAPDGLVRTLDRARAVNDAETIRLLGRHRQVGSANPLEELGTCRVLEAVPLLAAAGPLQAHLHGHV